MVRVVPRLSRSRLRSRTRTRTRKRSSDACRLSTLTHKRSKSPLGSAPAVLPLSSVSVPRGSGDSATRLVSAVRDSRCRSASDDIRRTSGTEGVRDRGRSGGDSRRGSYRRRGFGLNRFFTKMSFLILLTISELFLRSRDRSRSRNRRDKLRGRGGRGRVVRRIISPTARYESLRYTKVVRSVNPRSRSYTDYRSRSLIKKYRLSKLSARSSHSRTLVFIVTLSLRDFLRNLKTTTRGDRPGRLFVCLVSLFKRG